MSQPTLSVQVRKLEEALGWEELSTYELLAGGEATVLPDPPAPSPGTDPAAGTGGFLPRTIEDTPLKDLREDEILAYLARRAAERNPGSPHYRPDQV